MRFNTAPQVDARDNVRPLNYRGRFLEGVSAKLKEKFYGAISFPPSGMLDQGHHLYPGPLNLCLNLLGDCFLWVPG